MTDTTDRSAPAPLQAPSAIPAALGSRKRPALLAAAMTLAAGLAAPLWGAAAYAAPCRPGVAAQSIVGKGLQIGVSPCGGGVESVRLTEAQFSMRDPQLPSQALPGWSAAKWAAGPMELVQTWDARWDPFVDRVHLQESGPLEAAITLPGAVTPVVRTYADVAALAQAHPRWAVIASDARSVTLLWPDPTTVRAPLLLRKRVTVDPARLYVFQSQLEVWWLGSAPVQASLEHVLTTFQDPADQGGGFLESMAGPPDLEGVAMQHRDDTVHIDASSLIEAEDEDRRSATTPTWLATESKYFLRATAPVSGFETATAELRALGNGVLLASLRSAPTRLGSASDSCVPAALARALGRPACAEDLRLLGLQVDEGDAISAATLDAALAKTASTEAHDAGRRLRNRQVLRFSLEHFAGPKEIEALRAAGHEFEEAIDFGWFGAIARPLLFVLRLSHQWFGSWPLAILLLTVLVKALLWPVMGKSQQSMRKMTQLKPELDKLREDLTVEAKRRGLDAADPNEVNRATFALYQKHGVNPLGGCLPILLQMPVYIALYRTISSSVELYNQPLFGWIQDLTRHDPYYVLPVLLGVLMVAQQKLTPMTTMDEAQRKLMTWFMPIMFGVLMLSLPSGLTLYILTNTVLSIGQSWWYQRTPKA